MRTFKCSTKLIGAVGLGLCLYALSIVQCASQTPDSIQIPKAGWERLQSAIDGVADAMRAIRSAPTPTQTIQSTSPPPSTAANQLAHDPDPPVTTSQVYLDRDCCERHRYRGCCEPHRNRDCCGEMGRREPLIWRPPPCDYCDRWELDDQF